jgi:hypothetical protein
LQNLFIIQLSNCNTKKKKTHTHTLDSCMQEYYCILCDWNWRFVTWLASTMQYSLCGACHLTLFRSLCRALPIGAKQSREWMDVCGHAVKVATYIHAYIHTYISSIHRSCLMVHDMLNITCKYIISKLEHSKGLTFLVLAYSNNSLLSLINDVTNPYA